MDLQPPPPALAWSWSFLARILAGLRPMLGWEQTASQFLPVSTWRSLASQLRYLERLARRLLVVEAYALDVALPTHRGPARGSRPAGTRAAPGPCFRLREDQRFRFEPDSRHAGAETPDQGPGQSLRVASALAARLEALEALLQKRFAVARRMARLRRRKGGRFLRLWGMPERRRATSCLYASTLVHAHDLALDQMNRYPPWHPLAGQKPSIAP